jgi:hypothetical protein
VGRYYGQAEGTAMKTGLRSSGGYYHDWIKWMVAYWGESEDYEYEFEAKGEFRNSSIKPDVVLRYKGKRKDRASVVYVEVQTDVSKNWVKKKMIDYDGRHLIIVPVDRFLNTEETPWDVYKNIRLYLDTETLIRPTKAQERQGNYYKPCELCGKRIKKRNERNHLKYNCPKRGK